jgi:uncharacterized protein YlxW (UPF0749 family)
VATAPSPIFRYLLAIVLAVVGFLVVTSSKAPSAPRLSRRARLVDLIQREDDRTRRLRAQLDDLQQDLDDLEAGDSARQRELAALSAQRDALAPFAGLAAVRGRGLSVVLSDSSLREAPTGDPNDLVIHEQDLQAVINALWAAGAEAIAINGERITGRSAVRCVGNTLLLHGSVYAPPYRIWAVGPSAALEEGLDRSEDVERFRIAAEDFRLGFTVRREAMLALPAFRGATVLSVAEAAA